MSRPKQFFKLRAGASTSRFCMSVCPSVGQKNVKTVKKVSKYVKKRVKMCQKDVLVSIMTVKNVKKCQKKKKVETCQKKCKNV